MGALSTARSSSNLLVYTCTVILQFRVLTVLEVDGSEFTHGPPHKLPDGMMMETASPNLPFRHMRGRSAYGGGFCYPPIAAVLVVPTVVENLTGSALRRGRHSRESGNPFRRTTHHPWLVDSCFRRNRRVVPRVGPVSQDHPAGGLSLRVTRHRIAGAPL